MTDLLREPWPTIGVARPTTDIRAAARAMEAGSASEGQQRLLWRFIVYQLAGLNQLALAMPAENAVQNWRAGCRYVGAYLELARTLPAEDPPKK